MVSSTTNLPGFDASDCETCKSFITSDSIKQPHDERRLSPTKNAKRSLRKNVETKGSSLRQVTAAFIANLGTINTGMTMGFSAVAIPQLVSGDSDFTILNEQQASWVASLSSIGTLCGCILSAYLTDLLGRKRTLVLTELPAIAGWVTIAVAPSTEWIYVGRILTGVSSGMIGAPSRVYTAEVSQPHLRGMLSALASVGASLGVALEYWVGSICDWKMLAWISSIIPMFSLSVCFLLPESPSWLVSSGRKHKCFDSLKKLRGSTCDVQREVNTLVEFSERQNSNVETTVKQKLRNLCHATVLKPFLILTTYFFIYQMSGCNPLMFYIVNIFEDFGANHHQKYVFTVVIGAARLLFTIFGCVLMLRLRRRTLTFVSTVGCGLSMLVLGVYGFVMQYCESRNAQLDDLWMWIPISAIFIFIILSTMGYLIVPWVMIGELYPIKVRGLVGGLTTASCHFFIFIAVKSYPIMKAGMTNSGPFLIYGSISLLGTIFLYTYLPETKDKSLQEIEEHFISTKNIKNSPMLQKRNLL